MLQCWIGLRSVRVGLVVAMLVVAWPGRVMSSPKNLFDLMMNGQFDEARALIEKEPDSPKRKEALATLEQYDAARLVMRGEFEQAKVRFDKLPESPQKQLLLACLETEGGQLDAAAKRVEKLLSENPKAEEVKVLQALIQERRKAPNGSWLDAFVQARKAVPPASDEDALLPFSASAERPVSDSELAAARESDAFLLRVSQEWQNNVKGLYAEALKWARSDAPLAVHLLALEVLRSSEASAGHEEEARATRTDLLKRLSKANPDNVYVTTWAALTDRKDQRLSEADLLALEHALDARDRSSPFPTVFEAFEAAWMKVDPKQATQQAWGATFIVRAWPNVELTERVRATAENGSPATKERLARVLEKSGRVLAEKGTVLEFGLGCGLLRSAEKLSPKVSAEGICKKGDSPSLLSRQLTVLSSLPLPTLHREEIRASLTKERELWARLQKGG